VAISTTTPVSEGAYWELALGDLEFWFIHPYQRTLTTWRRQSTRSYKETVYRGGAVHPDSLPGVTIDLDTPFAP
jgi:Uma2 family endonuclease